MNCTTRAKRITARLIDASILAAIFSVILLINSSVEHTQFIEEPCLFITQYSLIASILFGVQKWYFYRFKNFAFDLLSEQNKRARS